MYVKEATLPGAKCQLIFSKGKSTLTASVLSEEPELGVGQNRFGVLVYALPDRKGGTIATVLISSEDQLLLDSALSMAKLLAATANRPTYLNTTVRTPPFMFMRELKELINTEVNA